MQSYIYLIVLHVFFSTVDGRCQVSDTFDCIGNVFSGLKTSGVTYPCATHGLNKASVCLVDQNERCSKYFAVDVRKAIHDPVIANISIARVCKKSNVLKPQADCVRKNLDRFDKCLSIGPDKKLAADLHYVDIDKPTAGYHLLKTSCNYFEAVDECISSSFANCGSGATNVLLEMIGILSPTGCDDNANGAMHIIPSLFALVLTVLSMRFI